MSGEKKILMAKVSSFRELIVWQKGMKLVQDVYRETARFPDSERFGLISQMRRAAVSMPANIAEGWSRQHRKEYVQHLNIALGSSGELQTLAEVARMLSFWSSPVYGGVDGLCEEIRKMLLAMIRKLR